MSAPSHLQLWDFYQVRVILKIIKTGIAKKQAQESRFKWVLCGAWITQTIVLPSVILDFLQLKNLVHEEGNQALQQAALCEEVNHRNQVKATSPRN